MASTRLKAFPHIDLNALPVDLHSRSRTGERARPFFSSDRFGDKLARALMDAQVLAFKELLESFEVFEHLRRAVRAPVVVDLCCGHGLVGMLYGIHHKDVEAVHLVDRTQPASVPKILSALDPVAPWLRAKVTYAEADIRTVALPEGAALLGIHAAPANRDPEGGRSRAKGPGCGL